MSLILGFGCTIWVHVKQCGVYQADCVACNRRVCDEITSLVRVQMMACAPRAEAFCAVVACRLSAQEVGARGITTVPIGCVQSKLEPRWLADVPMCGPRWAIALDAVSSLLTRASALESVLEVRTGLGLGAVMR